MGRGMRSRCKVCGNLGYVWVSCQDFEEGGFHERVFFFKEPVRTCSARMPGETWSENDLDKGQNRENNRNDFLLSV